MYGEQLEEVRKWKMLTFNNVRGTVEGGKKMKDINIQQCTGNS
jgi:hypothetical protein